MMMLLLLMMCVMKNRRKEEMNRIDQSISIIYSRPDSFKKVSNFFQVSTFETQLSMSTSRNPFPKPSGHLSIPKARKASTHPDSEWTQDENQDPSTSQQKLNPIRFHTRTFPLSSIHVLDTLSFDHLTGPIEQLCNFWVTKRLLKQCLCLDSVRETTDPDLAQVCFVQDLFTQQQIKHFLLHWDRWVVSNQSKHSSVSAKARLISLQVAYESMCFKERALELKALEGQDIPDSWKFTIFEEPCEEVQPCLEVHTMKPKVKSSTRDRTLKTKDVPKEENWSTPGERISPPLKSQKQDVKSARTKRQRQETDLDSLWFQQLTIFSPSNAVEM